MISKNWKINILALKRNVFFSLSDPTNKVKKILTPGLLLRSGVRRDEYNKLDNKKDRRKKRSWRSFINNQKRTPPACARTWNLMYAYILEKKLKSQNFTLVLGGSNLKLSRHLGKNIVTKSRLHVSHIITKLTPPHNGCPTKIKKRKKNKGRNRRLKRFLYSTRNRLPSAKKYVGDDNILLNTYHVTDNRKWLKTKLVNAVVKKKIKKNRVLRAKRRKRKQMLEK